MKKFAKDNQILVAFLIWRISLFLISFFASLVITKFGARFPYYGELLISTGLPSWIWGFGNFDGVHYLNIAQRGYFAQYSQVFFPLYPLLAKLLTINGSYFWTAFVFSNLLFLISLYFLYRLFLLDFDREISFKSLILLLVFPTAFYFGAIYTESLFLFLTVISFLLIRQKNFLGGGVAASLASSTRILGLFLLPILLLEVYLDIKNGKLVVKSKQFIKALIGIFIAPLGAIFYMVYLKFAFNNPLYFLTSQPIFGAERSEHPFILFPQVIFRYLKIFFSVPILSLPFFNAFLELVFTVIPLVALILVFRKIRLSYFVFMLGCLILPTLTGTLSSMPRYVLMAFLLLPFIAKGSQKFFRPLVFVLVVLEAILLSLFVRGYWIA